MKKEVHLILFCFKKLIKMRGRLTIGLFLMFMMTGCSWVEYFTITNTSKNNVAISYTLNLNQEGLQIFNTTPNAYALTTSKGIDWNKQLEIIDTDTSKEVISIILPPNSSLIIGELSNDTYKNFDQQFINGRIFNLKEVIVKPDRIIIPSTFDSFFIKKKGRIDYQVEALN